MKKLLLEYTNIIGYTIVGLVFGLSFFLLFINFYHAKELSEVVDISAYTATNRQNMENKLSKIKANAASYHQATYHGSQNVFDMNGVQIRLNTCVELFENDEGMAFLKKNKITLQDAYQFNLYYQNKILNDCVVMQLNTLGSETTTVGISSLQNIRPFIRLDIDHLLTTPAYISSNLKNADAYFFSNSINKSSIFHLSRDSYYATMTNYQHVLDLLLEISQWYKNVAIGG